MLQKVEQLLNVTQFFAANLPLVAEPVIEVPKILPDRVPQRIVERRPPQMAEQLVEVPTEPVYVLVVLASKVFSTRELSGFLSGQGSTASGSRFLEEVVDNPVPQGRGGGGARAGLQGSRARQNSTAADVEQIVSIPAKVRSWVRPLGRNCSPSRAHPRGELMWTLMGRRWWMRMGTRGGSRVLVGGTCLAVIVLCGGMLQGDVVTSL